MITFFFCQNQRFFTCKKKKNVIFYFFVNFFFFNFLKKKKKKFFTYFLVRKKNFFFQKNYFFAFFLFTIFTSNYNFTSAQTNLLCTFVNLDCNNDGIVDSVLNGGVPLVISNPTSSFNYTTTNIPCDSSALSGLPVGNYTISIDC